MKYLIRAAFAALSLATITPVANAAAFGTPLSSLTQHQTPYDKTYGDLATRDAGQANLT